MPFRSGNAGPWGALSVRNSAYFAWFITGPPKKIGSPLFSSLALVGRLRITPTVLPSSDWVTSTTAWRKFGSRTAGLATSRPALGRSPCCPAAGSPSSRTAMAAARSTVPLIEGLNTGDGAPQDQRVDVVRAFVGIDDLEVDEVADDAELVGDAVAAEHVARHARDVERLAAGISLHDRGDFHRSGAVVLHAAQAQAALQAEGDLGLHVGELLLHELVGGERSPELLAVEHILPCPVPAVLGSA